MQQQHITCTVSVMIELYVNARACHIWETGRQGPNATSAEHSANKETIGALLTEGLLVTMVTAWSGISKINISQQREKSRTACQHHCQRSWGRRGRRGSRAGLRLHLQVDGIYLAPSEEVQQQALGHPQIWVILKAFSNKNKTWLHQRT